MAAIAQATLAEERMRADTSRMESKEATQGRRYQLALVLLAQLRGRQTAYGFAVQGAVCEGIPCDFKLSIVLSLSLGPGQRFVHTGKRLEGQGQHFQEDGWPLAGGVTQATDSLAGAAPATLGPAGRQGASPSLGARRAHGSPRWRRSARLACWRPDWHVEWHEGPVQPVQLGSFGHWTGGGEQALLQAPAL